MENDPSDREFVEMWDSRTKLMLGEAAKAGFDEVVAKAIVDSIHAYVSCFMATAGQLPETLKDMFASCSVMLLEDLAVAVEGTGIVETPEEADKIIELAHRSRKRMESRLDESGLSTGEREDVRLYMGVMGMALLNLLASLGARPCELFVRMCREHLEAGVKLHDRVVGN